ncbi:MAG: phycobilisome protein [Cyanobacteria bacterium J083]|nr:MAG: phycobilisome protein [Cyanobacteria bacterium J083]
MTQLTEKVIHLIKKSRIVSFQSWEDACHPEIIDTFQTADNEFRYLTDEDIEKIKNINPELTPALRQSQLLRDKATEIVGAARRDLLNYDPSLIQPGGGLYPPSRAEACWRDFWQFLRCISYGVAGESTHYTSDEGLGYMEKLYRELAVPLPAMVMGLKNLKKYSLDYFEPEIQVKISPYFDHLIAKLQKFTQVEKV